MRQIIDTVALHQLGRHKLTAYTNHRYGANTPMSACQINTDLEGPTSDRMGILACTHTHTHTHTLSLSLSLSLSLCA